MRQLNSAETERFSLKHLLDFTGQHDTDHNNTQHNGTQYNDAQHKATQHYWLI